MATKITKNQMRWNNLTSEMRLKIDTLTNRGIQTDYTIPKAPAIITEKQIKNLMKIKDKIDTQFKRSTPPDNDILNVKRKGKQIETGVGNRQRTNYRPYSTRIILDRYYDRANTVGGEAGERIRRILDSAINTFGETRTAEALQRMSEDGKDLFQAWVYESEGQTYLAVERTYDFVSYLIHQSGERITRDDRDRVQDFIQDVFGESQQLSEAINRAFNDYQSDTRYGRLSVEEWEADLDEAFNSIRNEN